jgi:hypothetical protein
VRSQQLLRETSHRLNTTFLASLKQLKLVTLSGPRWTPVIIDEDQNKRRHSRDESNMSQFLLRTQHFSRIASKKIARAVDSVASSGSRIGQHFKVNTKLVRKPVFSPRSQKKFSDMSHHSANTSSRSSHATAKSTDTLRSPFHSLSFIHY